MLIKEGIILPVSEDLEATLKEYREIREKAKEASGMLGKRKARQLSK